MKVFGQRHDADPSTSVASEFINRQMSSLQVTDVFKSGERLVMPRVFIVDFGARLFFVWIFVVVVIGRCWVSCCFYVLVYCGL